MDIDPRKQWRQGADDAEQIATFFRSTAGLITAAVAVLVVIGVTVYSIVTSL